MYYKKKYIKKNNYLTPYQINVEYCKTASSNMSHLEAHVGFFRLLMKGIFGPYVM
jgi:hypothetical protein